MTNHTAQLTYGNKKIELPADKGTLGPDVIDVSTLNKQDLFTLDAGFMSTASCESQITYIDGEQGILLHRGYPIAELAEHCTFLEVAYLLIFGELPNQTQKTQFEQQIKDENSLPDNMQHFFNGLPQDTHPMAMLLSSVGMLSGFYKDAAKIKDPENRLLSAIRLIAKMPILSAMCGRHSQQKDFLNTDNRYSYTENFLHLLLGSTSQASDPNPILTNALDKIFILHADHEQNASTSAVRMTGSTGANPFACVCTGIGTLWGPAHGGANEACLNMLHQIGSESQIEHYIARAKDKQDPFRLMGFGHRVYKNYDPRAKVMRQICHEVLEELGVTEDPLFKLAMKLEKIALEDDYFIQRKLYPNVDFYSGITLSALGIHPNMFTVLFALSRTAGWVAHWLEMLNDPNHRLARPRQLYTGSKERAVVPIEKRGI